LSDFNQIEFFDTFSKNIQIPNLIKIRPVGAELFHADRMRGIRDENFANSPAIVLKKIYTLEIGHRQTEKRMDMTYTHVMIVSI